MIRSRTDHHTTCSLIYNLLKGNWGGGGGVEEGVGFGLAHFLPHQEIVCPHPATLEVGQRSRSQHGANWKGLSQGSCTPNIKALSLILQKIWARLKFLWQTDRQGHTEGRTDKCILMTPASSKGGGQQLQAYVKFHYKPMWSFKRMSWEEFLLTTPPSQLSKTNGIKRSKKRDHMPPVITFPSPSCFSSSMVCFSPPVPSYFLYYPNQPLIFCLFSQSTRKFIFFTGQSVW